MGEVKYAKLGEFDVKQPSLKIEIDQLSASSASVLPLTVPKYLFHLREEITLFQVSDSVPSVPSKLRPIIDRLGEIFADIAYFCREEAIEL